MQIATPRGEPTWRRGERETVIDLTFLSLELPQRLEYCGPVDEWALTSDHIPIRIALRIDIAPGPAKGRYTLRKPNAPALCATIRTSNWSSTNKPLEALQQTLIQGIQTHCEKAKPNRHIRKTWSPQASDILANARRARRDYARSHLQQDEQRVYKLAEALKKELRRASRASWRTLLGNLSTYRARKQQTL
jgi:hypothetical protein